MGKVYLPPGARYYGCRNCHRLTYTSCQQSGRFESVYRLLAEGTGLDAADVRRVMNRIAKGKG